MQVIMIVLVVALSVSVLFLVRKRKVSDDLHLSGSEQTQFLTSILDHSGTSSAILDSDGIIRYANYGFEAFITPKELPLTDRYIGDIPQLKKLERSFSRETSSVVSVTGHDGTPYLIKYFTVKDSHQQTIGRFLKMLPDIHSTDSLLDYDISHELKTPLHAILGFSELLSKNEDLTNDQQVLLEKIIQHSRELDDKITSLIGISDDSETDTETGSVAHDKKVTKILVVDDVSINRTLLKLMLQRYGLEVKEASNGEAALKILENWDADTILMDLSMPVMDGLATVKAIRSMEESADSIRSKIIAVTATQRYTRDELSDVGFDDLMQKPFKEEDLLPRLGIAAREADSH